MPRVIRELQLDGFLSFAPGTPPIELQSLNVMIGPNGSGKSNLIDAIRLMSAAPVKLTGPLRSSPVADWIWKGPGCDAAAVQVVVENQAGQKPLRHFVEFHESGARFELLDEGIQFSEPKPGEAKPYFFYQYQRGNPFLNVKEGTNRHLQRQDVAFDESILSQFKDPLQYPELSYLSNIYEGIRIYNRWNFGRPSTLRGPQPADLRSDRLEEDFSNLGLFLNQLRGVPAAKRAILGHLRDLYEGLDDFDVSVKGGTVEVFLTEGDFVLPATRLSDGTLRFLGLLALLCDPEPPPVLCIEEPELGLHPDLLPKVADLLREAAERTQVIVTTHSDILIDAMTDSPEAVMVFEKIGGKTAVQRLDRNRLSAWLEKYRLGELWIRGEIGGTRW